MRGEISKRKADLDRLGPVDARAESLARGHRIRQPHPEDGPDQGVRTRRRDRHQPGAEVPGDRREQKGHHHRQPLGRVDRDQQLDRQQADDPERDGRPAQVDAQEVAEPRPGDRLPRPQRLGVDHRGHRVGRVVEPVDELEPKAIPSEATRSSDVPRPIEASKRWKPFINPSSKDIDRDPGHPTETLAGRLRRCQAGGAGPVDRPFDREGDLLVDGTA